MKAVNLIPSEQRVTAKTPAAGPAPETSDDGAFGAYIILGALVLAIAVSALYVLTANSIKDRKAELARVSAEAERASGQASSLQAFADFESLADSRRTTVRALAGSRFDWPRTLADVSRALPGDVYVNALDGSTSGGGGGTSSTVTIAAPSIKLTGCTRSQSSVARLMSSLRNVRGVTRVSLTKSDAQEAALAPPVAPAPPAPPAGKSVPQTTTEPCPKGAAPNFELTMYFERAAASAGAAANLAAGPGGAASGTTGPAGATSTVSTAGPTGASGATTPTTKTP